MKTKKFSKKLVLKRETIATLSEEMKKNVVGGTNPDTCITDCTCPNSYIITCDPCPESLDTCVSCLYLNTFCQGW